MKQILKALSAFRDFLFLATRHWISAIGVALATFAAISMNTFAFALSGAVAGFDARALVIVDRWLATTRTLPRLAPAHESACWPSAHQPKLAHSSLLHGLEVEVGRASADLPSVFDALVDRAAEVNAHQDARQPVLLRGL